MFEGVISAFVKFETATVFADATKAVDILLPTPNCTFIFV
jgi:hypothetical protein